MKLTLANRGSTLLELIIYIALLSVVLTFFAAAYVELLAGQRENRERTNVHSNLTFATVKINQDLGSATAVTSPAVVLATSTELNLTASGESISYCVVSSTLHRDTDGSCGVDSPAITTNDVRVESLGFVRLENENAALSDTAVSIYYSIQVSASGTPSDSLYSSSYQTAVALP